MRGKCRPKQCSNICHLRYVKAASLQTTHGKERLFVATTAERNFRISIYYIPHYRPMFKVENES